MQISLDNLKNTYFTFKLVGIKPDVQDVYNEILEKVFLHKIDKYNLNKNVKKSIENIKKYENKKDFFLIYFLFL